MDAAVAREAAGEEAAGEAAGEDAGDDAGDDAEALPPFTAEVATEQQQPHQPQANDEPTEQAQQLEAQQQQQLPEQAQPQQHEAQLVAQQQELTMEQQQQDNMMNWLTEEGLFDAVVQMTQDGNDDKDNPNNNDNNNNCDITIDAIRDGVVGNDTLRQYMSEIIKFLVWCRSDKPDWLHPPATARLDAILQRWDNERMRAYNTRMRQQIKSLLQAADTNPVLTVEAITPLGYMSYVMLRRHQGHGGYLSKSAYGSIRAALFHLFCLHNRSGFSDSFRLELGNLFKVFYRSLTRQQREAQSQEQGNQEQ